MPAVLKDAIRKYKVHSLETDSGADSLTISGNDRLGGAPPLKLTFNMQRQVQTNWCWAATSASVSVFYDTASKWTQCLVAKSAMGSDCCRRPAPCDNPWYLDRALTITGNFVNEKPHRLTFSAVKTQLKKGRVIGVRIGWNGGGGHFVVIHGCKTVAGINYLSIDDPFYGKSEITETAFNTAYQGSGSWTDTFTTKS